MQQNPFDQFDSTPSPGPVRIGTPDPYKQRDQQLQEEAARRADAAARRAEDAAARQEREFAATHNPDGSPKAPPKQIQSIPAAAATAIQENLQNLQQIDRALADLDPTKGRPQSIGPGTGFFGDTFTQFNDPKGSGVRADVGQIGATRIHDLSGAAVSATEAPRFQPFVPTVTDRPEVAAEKLRKFRDALSSQIKEQLDFYGPANGYTPYRTPQIDQFMQGAQDGPRVAPGQTEQGFDLKADPRNTELSPEQAAVYDAWWKANPNPTPAQLVAFGHAINLNIPPESAKAIIDAARQGRGISHDVEVKPYIGDVRGNGGVGETADAAIRGAADTASLGLADKAAALGDTVFKGGTFDQNLGRQYAISDFDSENHPIARIGGQIAGGAALPMGEVSGLGNLAAKGAGYGAAYGLGSSRSLGDVPLNVAGGAVAGAAIPAALGGAGRLLRRGAAKEIPPLVDPQTGELNQPMDAMRPADRVQSMRDYGMETITPGMAGGRSARVLEQGLNNVPGSAGVMEDVNSAASGELRRSMQGVAQKFGSSKTLNEGGAQLQRGAKQFIDRADDVATKLYARIPVAPTAPSNLSSTTAYLGKLSNRFSSNPDLAEMLNNPQFSKKLDALQKHGLSWEDLQDFRTMIGDKIGTMRFGENDNTGDFRGLYAALSEDMKNTAAAHGPRALKAFERANNFYREKESLIEDSLTRILGPDSKGRPEAAAAAVQAMTKGGKSTGDLRTLAQVKAATVKSGAWDEIASTLIHLGGQPANSEGRAFQPATFVNWYADMAEPARAMLFKPELRKALDGFVAINQQLSRLKGLSNTSNTTPTMIGSGVVSAAGIGAAVGHPMGLVAIAGGGAANYGMAKLWTNPKFVSLITGYGRAVAAGNQNAVKSQVGRLSKLAATNPELAAPIQSLLRNIANDNAVSGIAASPDANDQNQNQQ